MRASVFAHYILTAVACAGCWESLLADEGVAEQSALGSKTILARIGVQTIDIADVDFFLGRRPKDDLPALPFTTRENALHLFALQRQALETLRAQKLAVTDAEIDDWIVAQSGASEPQRTLENVIQTICQQHGLSREKYRAHVAFRLSWQRYLDNQLTEDNLKKHFARQHARFDGTRFKVDVASVPVPAGNNQPRVAAHEALKKLGARFSDEPPSDEATVIVFTSKWVRGSGDLDPSLITPLLSSVPGDFSKPLDTASGVHIIRLIDTEAGKLQLAEVRGQVRAHMLLYLLEYLAQPSQEHLPLVRL